MFKIIITAIIILVVLLSYLSTNPAVSGFFVSIKDKASSLITPNQKLGDTNFVLTIDTEPDIGFSSDKARVTVRGRSTGSLDSNSLNTDRTLTITDFTGNWDISGNTLTLEGRHGGASLPDVSFDAGTVSIQSFYDSAKLENVLLNSLDLDGKGTLTIKGTETRFEGIISLNSVIGVLIVEDAVKIEGTASKISIPSAGIMIE